MAGVTVGLVALPLAMAFAISSGVTPQAGLYCAIVTGGIISRSADRGCRSAARPAPSSWSSPASRRYGVDGLFMCTMMAGRHAGLLGADRHGHRGPLHPRPVVVGFTNGIARAHREHADPGFLRPADRPRARRVPGRGWRRSRGARRHLSRRRRRWRSARSLLISLATGSSRRFPATIVALVAGTLAVTSAACPSKRSDRGSAASRAGLPPFDVPQFRPT